MQLQGRMKTSTHLLVGYAFDDAMNHEALLRDRRSRNRTVKSLIQSALTTVGQWLLRDPNQPQIRKIVDRFDNTYWHVYDPQTHQRFTFDHEAAVRQWLEQRYYQPIA